jgi:nitroreductase
MSVLDLMKRRCSVRAFEDRPVEREKLGQVLEAARVAPSACNFQPWHFIVLEDEKDKQLAAEDWVAKAPAVIVVCGDHSRSWRRKDGKDHCDIDVAIAVDHMTLAAVELGLGTCWVCWFDAFRCSLELKLPDHLEPVALLPIGYPTQTLDPDRHNKGGRRDLTEIVSWGGYSKVE